MEGELRALVRQMIREAVPQLSAGSTGVRSVRIANDDDLQSFVMQLVSMLDDPARGAEVRSGALRFRLDPAPTSMHGAAPKPDIAVPEAAIGAGPSLQIDKGAITEKVVARAAAAGARRIIAGPRAVITPLAREQMRKSEITLERRTC